MGKRSGLWFLLGVKEEEWCDMLRKLPETWTDNSRKNCMDKNSTLVKIDSLEEKVRLNLLP